MPSSRSPLFRWATLIAGLLIVLTFGLMRLTRLPESEALRIAQAYVNQHHGWVASARYEIKRSKEHWEITIIAPHDLSTGTRVLSVEVDDRGQVTGFM